MRHQYSQLIIILAALASQITFATTNGEVTSSSSNFISWISSSYVITASLGPVWESGGEAQTLNLAPGMSKDLHCK